MANALLTLHNLQDTTSSEVSDNKSRKTMYQYQSIFFKFNYCMIGVIQYCTDTSLFNKANTEIAKIIKPTSLVIYYFFLPFNRLQQVH